MGLCTLPSRRPVLSVGGAGSVVGLLAISPVAATDDASDCTVAGAVAGACRGCAGDGTEVSVRWRSDDPAAVEAELAWRWPPLGLARLSSPSGGPVEMSVDVVVNGGEVEVTVDGQPAPGGWDRVESELGLFSAERLRGSVAVHAAVVETTNGAMVVAGTSGSGKSTLCAAARELGLRVHSDEYALVDEASGAVRGWPRPMRLRTPDGPVRVPLQAGVGEPLPVALVVLVAYEPDGPGLRAATQGEAVMGLLANTVCASRRPSEAFAAAVALARSAPAVSGTRGDAEVALVELVARAEPDARPSPT